MSGDEARKILVTNRNLSAVLGYSLLVSRLVASSESNLFH